MTPAVLPSQVADVTRVPLRNLGQSPGAGRPAGVVLAAFNSSIRRPVPVLVTAFSSTI